MPRKKYDKLLFGFLPSLFLPTVFIWVYISTLYPIDMPVLEVVKNIFPSRTLGNLLMLSYIPDMLGMFIFYKLDAFRIAAGFFIGGLPYFITSFFML